MNQQPIKILYIAGWARVGSTILSRVLHQVTGYVSVGELRYVWDRGLQDNRRSGDGVPFRESPFWREVFDRAYGGMENAPAQRMAQLYPRLTPKRALGYLMLGGETLVPRGYREYMDHLQRLYRALAEVSGAEVIVDSSKVGTYGQLLSRLPGFDVRVVHIVRNPLAVAFSWKRKVARTDVSDGSALPNLGPADNAFHWWYWNVVANSLARRWNMPYRLLRYEDFIAMPRTETERLMEFMDTPRDTLPFVSENEIELKPDVAVSGNPRRMKTGTTALRLDDEWRGKLSLRDRWITQLIAGRMMRRYGYR